MTQNEPAEPAVRPPVPGPQGPGQTASGRPSPTGDPQVDAALDKLADLDGLPLTEHPAVFGQIHGALAGALGTLDSGAGAGGTGHGDPGN